MPALPIVLLLMTMPAQAIEAAPDVYARPKGDGDWFAGTWSPSGGAGRRLVSVSLALTVSDTGKPTQCEITSSSGVDRIDARTCALAMKNARFTPARKDGRAVASLYRVSNVSWPVR